MTFRRGLVPGEVRLPPGWLLQSLADVGLPAFTGAMLLASQGDPHHTSTADTARDDLLELVQLAGDEFDASQWFLVRDLEGPVGVVLPQPLPSRPGQGTLLYLAVVPQRRGAGLGHQLHALGLRLLAARGVTEYRGEASAANRAMLAVFRHNGCEQSPTRGLNG